MSVNKYIKNNDINSEHWIYCEKNKFPFIQINRLNALYSEIFFDITNLYNSEEIKSIINTKLRSIYISYCDFFNVDYSICSDYIDNEYFFQFAVFIEHSEFIASRLYDFLSFYYHCK